MTGPPQPPPAQPPPVPPPARRPIALARVAIGFGIAIGAHLLTLVPILLGYADSDWGVTGALVFLGLQVLLFPTLLVLGIVGTVRQDGGIGVGLMIGWAIGVLVSFGGCVALINAGATG
jgi:hypothetical protein